MLFVHDHTFVNNAGNLYTTGSLNQRIMDRYKSWFGNVSVFATTREAGPEDSAFIRPENLVQGIRFDLVEKNYNIFYLLRIRKRIERAVKEADCVVVRMSVLGTIAVHYARKHKISYMIEMVACPWDSLWHHSIKGKLFAPFMTIITKIICKQASRVLYVTTEFLQRRYPTNGVQIGCSDVELTDINEAALNKRLLKIQQLDPKSPMKLCTLANNNVKYKGQDIVIRSLPELKKQGYDFEYYLVGGGNPSRLQSIAKECGVSDKVHIIGPKPHDEIFELLDEMDIYLQPSLTEGLPRAVIEAMSRACPVIGSSTGGIPELIDGSYVFQKGNKKSLIRTIIQLMNKQQMIDQAKKNFLKSKNFDLKKINDQRNKFYLEFKKEALAIR